MFSSSSDTLNIGSNTNNIRLGTNKSSGTVNLGDTETNVNINGSSVNIRGLDTLINSANTNPTFRSDISYNSYCYYMLPFTTNRNLLIQWGYVDANETTPTVTFPKQFSETPYLFLTKYDDSDWRAAGISFVSSAQFIADIAVGSSNKGDFNWLAIGIIFKSQIV
jgi:hypothetical protein